LLKTIRSFGCSTIYAVTAGDAFYAAQTFHPRLVSVDYGLLCRPGDILRTGWDLLEAMFECPATHDMNVLVIKDAQEEVWERLKVLVCSRNTDNVCQPVNGNELQTHLASLDLARKRRSQRILLVEDDHAVASYVQRTLSEGKFDLDVVFNGRDAVKRLERRPKRYGAVILDMQVPGMSGFEVIRTLRLGGVAADVPVIALSCVVSPRSTEEARIVRCGTFLETVAKEDFIRSPNSIKPRIINLINNNQGRALQLPAQSY
jgi:CheY-like chemotaxis protein